MDIQTPVYAWKSTSLNQITGKCHSSGPKRDETLMYNSVSIALMEPWMIACGQLNRTEHGSMTKLIRQQANADSLIIIIALSETPITILYPVVVAAMLIGIPSQLHLKPRSASHAMAPRSGPTTFLLHAIQYAQLEDHFLIQQHRILCKSLLTTNSTTSLPIFSLVHVKSCGADSKAIFQSLLMAVARIETQMLCWRQIYLELFEERYMCLSCDLYIIGRI